MLEDKYKNVFYVDGCEVLPLWKRSGKYDPNWSELEKWLWYNAEVDYHMEPVGKLQLFSIPYKLENGSWYVWINSRNGDIHLMENGKYIARMRCGGMCWDSQDFDTIEEAARYIIAHCKTYKNIKSKHDV